MTTAYILLSLATAIAARAIARVGSGPQHAGMPWVSASYRRRIAPLTIERFTQ